MQNDLGITEVKATYFIDANMVGDKVEYLAQIRIDTDVMFLSEVIEIVTPEWRTEILTALVDMCTQMQLPSARITLNRVTDPALH